MLRHRFMSFYKVIDISMNEKILRQYISLLLKEESAFSWVDLPDQAKKVKSTFKKIQRFFTGDVSNIAEDYIEEKEDQHDIELPDEIKNEIIISVDKNWQKILDSSKGDKKKALKRMKGGLDLTFGREISALARGYSDDYFVSNVTSNRRKPTQTPTKSDAKVTAPSTHKSQPSSQKK